MPRVMIRSCGFQLKQQLRLALNTHNQALAFENLGQQVASPIKPARRSTTPAPSPKPAPSSGSGKATPLGFLASAATGRGASSRGDCSPPVPWTGLRTD